jgi:hypothetical protein
MYYIFKARTDSIKSIEASTDKNHAIARMEYLAINNLDSKATMYYVESSDNVRIAEYEV